MTSAVRASIRCLRGRLGILDAVFLKNFRSGTRTPVVAASVVLQKYFSSWSNNPHYGLRSDFGWWLTQRRAYSVDQTPGGNEVFGNMTAQSGINDDMLDSLIALKDFGNIEGLPSLDMILEQDDELERKAKRRELEETKQMELRSLRIKTVDEYGRAYATGRRKASIARVWLKEGQGKITINGLPHDQYFPDIDQRLQLLEPFCQTHTLGLFDIRSTVRGGGITGQSGALRHGISKALQLFDPLLRPSLKSAGMLTRDSRVVERKKPGKAKARKSYQWVKR